MPEEREPFEVEFASAERKAPSPGYTDAYPVTFRAKRGFQNFTIPVWVGRDTCRPSDIIRVAMHRLHLDLLELVEGTRSLHLSPEEYRALVPKGSSREDDAPQEA